MGHKGINITVPLSLRVINITEHLTKDRVIGSYVWNPCH